MSQTTLDQVRHKQKCDGLARIPTCCVYQHALLLEVTLKTLQHKNVLVMKTSYHFFFKICFQEFVKPASDLIKHIKYLFISLS